MRGFNYNMYQEINSIIILKMYTNRKDIYFVNC